MEQNRLLPLLSDVPTIERCAVKCNEHVECGGFNYRTFIGDGDGDKDNCRLKKTARDSNGISNPTLATSKKWQREFIYYSKIQTAAAATAATVSSCTPCSNALMGFEKTEHTGTIGNTQIVHTQRPPNVTKCANQCALRKKCTAFQFIEGVGNDTECIMYDGGESGKVTINQEGNENIKTEIYKKRDCGDCGESKQLKTPKKQLQSQTNPCYKDNGQGFIVGPNAGKQLTEQTLQECQANCSNNKNCEALHYNSVNRFCALKKNKATRGVNIETKNWQKAYQWYNKNKDCK
jgi:hypothetical protein